MFRHYHVILKELAFINLSSYISTSTTAAMGALIPEDDTIVSKHVAA
jgi:hypothetical protein